jgi:ferrochelatase
LAILLVSYGTPESKEEVLPFLNKLFAGKKVPPERIAAAVAKYEAFAQQTGQYSPLNEECRQLIAGILRELAFHKSQALNSTLSTSSVYWGNLFWHPLLEDTVAEMTRDGIEHAVYFATSAFDSEAGNKRYADAIESARQKIGVDAPIFEKASLPFEHPLFIEAQTDRLLEALAWAQLNDLTVEQPAEDFMILFSAHSIPKTDAAKSNYIAQLNKTCRTIIEKTSFSTLSWEIVYQSRSGLAEHWLEPEIKERIQEIAANGQYRTVIVSPVGFFCENMETVNDLDLEVGGLCDKLGLSFVRARAVGASPKICRMIVEMCQKQ